ncbi:uncharacterized protein [Nicotiana tomentosiformis]|uniref:uncharacterized protein isoform X2 n=1 Tax=Nicotiana tomentosiformis TaxID=4098 RepID=UPI00051BFF74|nr:uncharacterized protein LOC104114531 isoform X2 [Nicotiana tomentosiformis]
MDINDSFFTAGCNQMENGEGTKEHLTSAVSSPFVPLGNEFSWQSQKSEDGDDITEYSSCDAESEFERYCSANSAMGTPTVGGSVVTAFHEFPGSFKLGDDSYRVKGFRGCKKLSDFSGVGPSTRGSEYSGGKGSAREEGLVGIGKGLDLYGNAVFMDEETFLQNMDMGDEWYVKDDEMPNMRSDDGTKLCFNRSSCTSDEYKNGVLIEGDTEASGVGNNTLEIEAEFQRDIEAVDGSLEVSSPQPGTATGGAECLDESEASSRYEYSEGEDSMFGGNTDDEKNDSYFRKEVKHSHQEHDKNEYKLVMGSAVAFGSNDWDDFMQENGEFTPTLMVHNELQAENQPSIESENGCLSSASTVNAEFSSVGLTMPKEKEKGTLLPSYHGQGGNESTEHTTTYNLDPLSLLNQGKGENAEGEKPMLVKNNETRKVNESAEFHDKSSVHNMLQVDHNPQRQRGEASFIEGAKLKEEVLEPTDQCACNEEVIHITDDLVSRKAAPENLRLFLEPLSHSATSKDYLSMEHSDDRTVELSADKSSSPSSASVANDATRTKHGTRNSSSSVNYLEDHLTSGKTHNLELNEFYNEVVHDMEEILLDSSESPGFALGNKIHHSYIPLPSRDGGSTASTSVTFDVSPDTQRPVRFDRVEVVGARQKTGDVSLSERLVGVKKYTVYRIKVWSGEDYWEVERRYRDFCALYHQLKKSFADQGWILPPVWSATERESRKIFGSASPNVVADRSVLIQECLHSLLHDKFRSGPLNALICFLSPSKDVPNSPTSDTNIPQSPYSSRSTSRGDVSSLGKKISLIVHKRPLKSKKQLLDEQHYSCAGCYKSFDDGKTRIQELAQTLGWGKPRLCEYSGQLFCSSCHTNDMAVLPARVLHCWDFNQYPVSQLAKSYLDSIYDQPMLCVSAVNPMLFSRVPALQHVTNIRKRIEKILPFVRCPFRSSIYKGVGSRRYILEGNDFFALRDLIDLSKGVFAALPVMVDTVLRKIVEHITDQCLICYDVGIPCTARQDCDDPSSLIFPFQEGEIERCKSCDSVFHKHCFKRISSCPCGTRLKPEQEGNATKGSQNMGNWGILSLDLLRKRADLSKGLVTGFLGKVRSLKSSRNEDEEHEDNNAIILMDSLPMTTL